MSDAPARWTIIEPATRWPSFALRELWEYRELLYFLTWRDVKVRYKQTRARRRVGGPAAAARRWSSSASSSAGSPKMPSDGVPYPLFALAGARAVDVLRQRRSRSRRNSLVAQREPRHEGLLPAAGHPARRRARAGCVDFAIAFVRAARCMMRWYGVAPDGRLVAARCRSSLLAIADRARRRALARGAERAVPRRALRGAVPRPALAVRHADRLPEQPARPSRGATLYALNPMVGRGRGLPLGAARRRRRRPAPMLVASALVGARAPRRRRVLLPARRSGRSRTSSEPTHDGRRSARRASASATELGARRDALPDAARAVVESVGAPMRSIARRRAGRRSRVLGAARRLVRGRATARSVGIIGRNGAGKSTLLKILSRDHRADDGARRASAAGSARCSRSAPASTPS